MRFVVAAACVAASLSSGTAAVADSLRCGVAAADREADSVHLERRRLGLRWIDLHRGQRAGHVFRAVRVSRGGEARRPRQRIQEREQDAAANRSRPL